MSWDRDLQQASFRGVKFHVKRISDTLRRRWARQTYPYVDGEDIEDMGREPIETNLTAVFVGPDYLVGLSDLLQVVKDGVAGAFNHPLLGTRTARLSIDRIEHDETFRDGCLVDIIVLEDGAGGDVEKLETVYTLQAEMETIIVELEVDLEDVQGDLEDLGDGLDTIMDAIDEAREFIDDATSTITKAANGMNKLLKRVQKGIAAAQALGDVSSYKVVASLRKLGHTGQKLGKRVLGTKWPMRSKTAPADIPAVLMAHVLYGDASRADELMELNATSVRNPLLIPAGSVLQVFGS